MSKSAQKTTQKKNKIEANVRQENHKMVLKPCNIHEMKKLLGKVKFNDTKHPEALTNHRRTVQGENNKLEVV